MDYEEMIDDAYAGYVRTQFESFISNLLPLKNDGKTTEQREAKAIELFKYGMEFGKRARQLMIEAVK